MCLVNVLGLDPSLSATGWAVLQFNLEGEFKKLRGYGVIRAEKLRDAERLLFIETRIRLILLAFNPVLACIEGYAYGFKKGQGRYRESAGELGGVIRRLLYVYNISKQVIPPQSLKKGFAGTAKVDKDKILKLAQKRSGCKFEKVLASKRNNVSDAFAVACVGVKNVSLKEYVNG